MSVKSPDTGLYSVRAAVALVLGAAAMMAAAPRVGAQDQTPSANAAPAPVLEEVTVTGSRIKRKDLESSSPLVSVDSEQIEQRAGLNLESYLNNLPNYNPAQTPTTENEDVQPSAVNTVGIATISLRGLGSNRNLVLIDGHRTAPVNAEMETDINGIPAAMIDRVEIITGGASTVYGADAISGVTNFITKKDLQGLIIDAQDSITQAGDGNQLDVSAIMGTKVSDGRGNITAGLEYYNRQSAAQRNRDFFTNSWTDPNAPQMNSNAFFLQNNGYAVGVFPPSNAALATLFPGRGTSSTGAPLVCATPQSCVLQNFYFNPNGSIYVNTGPVGTSNYTGPTNGSGGFGLANGYDGTMPNSAVPGTPAPGTAETVKWSNPLATVTEPQTRYSFFANGTYDITDKIQFYSTARYAQSLTTTLLDTPTSGIFGWEASVPFNATTDSPINPTLINSTTSQATLQAISAAFAANPTTNAYSNPTFVGPGQTGQQHPVPWQLAMLLLSRPATFPGASTFLDGPVTCQSGINPALCSQAPTSWIANYLPQYSAPQRSSVDTTTVFQIETGIRFPVVADWTGDLYYSRGDSTSYIEALGNDSLERFRAVIDSPGYGQGQSFQGNYNGASQNFGTSVPQTCTSGFYNTLFLGDQTPSADCMTAVAAPLQSQNHVVQDVVEANFQGTLFKLPAGDVSAAVGYQYRRDANQFTPDNLQSTYSFLDQTIGLYPLGSDNAEISSRDGYLEFYVPVIADQKWMQKMNLDIGGRYSSLSSGSTDIPAAETFKINLDAQITKQFRIRGGFNRATRTPNLGELYLGEQEYFGGGAQYGDPCSVRSNAPFGAGGAGLDFSTTGSKTGAPTNVAPGQTAAGALSTYLICQAQMGAAGATYYYGNATSAGNTSQGGAAAPAVFAWLNEVGNSNLRSETANTWTGGIVLTNLSDNPWLSGLNASVDWWQIDINNAIELDSPDYANFLCYGSTIVTTAAQAAAQAATPACQNVGRNQTTGGGTTTLLTYTNQATIGISGVDVQVNWFAQFADLGFSGIPGGINFNTQDTFLDYYKTKQSPAQFDVDVNWKGSLGPTLIGTNAGAYSYRLTSTIGYVLPSVSVNLFWRFYPSVNSANYAFQQAEIQHDRQVAGGAPGILLGYTPNRDIAAPAWSAFDLSFSWNVNKILQVRGGIQNLFDKQPAITTENAGFPVGTNLNSVCGGAPGCQNPTAYVYPNDGAGTTNPGFYDVLGRTFFLGLKARF